MEYILKSTAILTIFYLFYKIFLQRETFFHSIRSYFLTGIISAIVIPFVVITKYVQIEPVSVVSDMVFTEIPTVTQIESFNWIQLFIVIYLIGVLFFSIRFIWQLSSLTWFLYTHPKSKKGKYTLVKTTKNMAPFSFFNYIAYNRDQFENNELEQIFTHEKAHANQLHSIDIVLSKLVAIVNWFNPFIWLYNKEIQKNLEYVADQFAHNNSLEKKKYQYLLLKTISPDFKMALASNFYNTLIKKRIDMLQKNRSSKTMQIKFALIIPILIAFVFTYNTEIIAQTKVSENEVITEQHNTISEVEETTETIEATEVTEATEATEIKEEIEVEVEEWTEQVEMEEIEVAKTSNEVEEIIEIEQTRIDFLINKDHTEYELNKLVTDASKEKVTVKIKGIKRNDQGEITAIKIDIRSDNSRANFNTSSNEPIKPIKIAFNEGGSNISIGNTGSPHEEHFFVSKEWKNKNKNTFFISSGGNGNKFMHTEGEHSNEVYEFKSGDSTMIWVSKGKNHFVHDIDAKDGNVEIIAIEEDDGKHKKHEIKVRKVGSDHDKKNNVIYFNSDYEKPLIFIDGKESTHEAMEELGPDKIQSMNVLKGEGAIKEYGNRAKNGVIKITTKK